jgi:cation diffusion facilitator CzcD-associated flavoprotein CzcO
MAPVSSGSALPAEVDVAIVGAGFGGLGAAIRLRGHGVEDLVVLEREADVGGTWFANTYPGCQCDVPSNLYSFSFAPNPAWTHSYPLQPQIQRYLRRCAERFGVLERTWLGCEVLAASWQPDEARWRIESSRGELRARVLIAAAGLLSEPSLPAIPGLDSFAGSVFHTARWDHGHDLRGERVGLVGTGATAIQVGPQIQPLVSRLHVFQRTPPWILPNPDRKVPEWARRLYAALPLTQRLARLYVYVLREYIAAGATRHRALLKLLEAVARVKLRREVRDRRLRRALRPDYDLGCKRLLLSDDWYPMLGEANTELVTAPIREVRERSVVTADGIVRELDAIVLATGFRATDPQIAHRLRGADGRTLADVWAGSPEAYLGTAVAGFPNLFLLYGPNVNLAHSSIVYMLESQIEHVRQAVGALLAGARSIEVRAEVQRAYNAELAERLAGTVWDSGGCRSWYLDANGRDSTNWPDLTFRYRRLVSRFDPADYQVIA